MEAEILSAASCSDWDCAELFRKKPAGQTVLRLQPGAGETCQTQKLALLHALIVTAATLVASLAGSCPLSTPFSANFNKAGSLTWTC